VGTKYTWLGKIATFY